MKDEPDEMLSLVRRIHDLLELMAEDKLAQRDAKQRTSLREIVGSGAAKQRAVFLMDGSRTQADIVRATSVNQGHLSVMIANLHKAKLLTDDPKKPKLAISIPANFFEFHEQAH